jgi:hypothetical protein
MSFGYGVHLRQQETVSKPEQLLATLSEPLTCGRGGLTDPYSHNSDDSGALRDWGT